MWFGVAPSPAPSPPRTNTQSWHPPHCTCARHRKAIAPAHEQQLRGYNAPSPRAHMLSPRKQLQDAKASALPLAGSDDKNVQQAVPAPASVGPMSPRAHRRQREQHTKMVRKPQESSRLDSFLGRAAGVVTSSKRDTSALWDSLDAVTLARSSTKEGRDVAEEPALALVDDKQPQESDTRVINSSGNGFGCALDDDTTHDNNNQNDVVLAERKASRSGRRASRGADRVRNAEHPPTGNADLNDVYRLDPLNDSQAPPAPPKSRRSSRTYSAFAIDNLSDQNSSSEHLSGSFSSRVQPENLVGHVSSICSVVASDDRYVISCSVDRSVKVWSRASFSCLHTLFGHEDNVSCIDIKARWLVSGSHDTTLRVYSCLDGFTLLHELRGHTAHVTKVHLPPACPQQILSCSDDSTIRIWNGELGHCTFVLRDHSSRITCFYTEGRRVCSGAADAAVCFWDLPTTADKLKNRELRATEAFRVHKATVQVLTANSSVDSTLILSGSNDGAIQIFNFQTLEYIGCLDLVHSPIYSMCLLSNSQLVCSTGDGRLLHFSDLYSHPLVKSELRLADKWISMLQPRGNTVVCSSEDLLYVVDAEQLRVLAVIETMHGFVNSVGWLHATALISGGQDNVVKIWNIG
ncbi:Wd domain-containing protein [Globisporangium polare]